MPEQILPNHSPCPVIGITLGDPAGIGPEVIDAAIASGKLDSRFQYRVIGKRGFQAGAPSPASARAAFEALEEAAKLVIAGAISAVVTGPIHKHRMKEHAGFDFPGMTEFFAERCGVRNFAMCLTGGALTVGLVTCHVPLREVPDLATSAEIIRVGTLLAQFVHRRLNRVPRIAVAGLNPHAGESGAFGREEIEVISPAVEHLNRGITGHPPLGEFTGPLSPDTVFNRAVAGEFDAVLCMYHDQGLIPLKLHAFDQGVNVTLGLPVIRTSPDHGTAFEIAGKGIARPDSMIAAIQLASQLATKPLHPAQPWPYQN